jgi:hypothetical protein
MALSTDNQDYGKSDEKNKQNKNINPDENKLTSDDLKGKKVDADLELDTDKPPEQEKK